MESSIEVVQAVLTLDSGGKIQESGILLLILESCILNLFTMVLPGHLAGGYLATKALLLLTYASFSTSQTTALLIIGTLAGELPDIDLIPFYLANRFNWKSVQSHRNYITHAPAFWLIISLVIVATGLIFQSSFTEFIGWAILCGTWSHLILDSIEDGVMWLWPFTKRCFALGKVSSFDPAKYGGRDRAGSIKFHLNYIRKVYLKERVSFYIEILITIAALYVVLR